MYSIQPWYISSGSEINSSMVLPCDVKCGPQWIYIHPLYVTLDKITRWSCLWQELSRTKPLHHKKRNIPSKLVQLHNCWYPGSWQTNKYATMCHNRIGAGSKIDISGQFRSGSARLSHVWPEWYLRVIYQFVLVSGLRPISQSPWLKYNHA